MKLLCVLLGLSVISLAGAGCVSVKTPEKIEIGASVPDSVDSSRLPQTASHEECRQELYKAYQNIQYLERENQHLKQKADKYKRERDECRKRLEKFEKD